MNRREALSRVALMMGGALSAPTLLAFNEGAVPLRTGAAFSLTPAQQALIAEVAEHIIPRTSTPGAKDAGVGPFIELMLKDCYKAQEQQNFLDGLADLDAQAAKAHGKKFLETTSAEQVAILKQVEKKTMDMLKNANVKQVKVGDNVDKQVIENENIEEDKKNQKADKEAIAAKKISGTPFWRLMKELTLFGYFTSEQGATKALDYVPIPGRYDGCIPLKKGQKAYAL
ncbi:gluconate 2-dehydrogenase subunit 3 family protein [Runella slithyformis]|uniref:Twin-arginine translocation pathway signal n=1 Tax=Runella slithyformis (strain ATCC 29530 / DSM 19594 / LMG 11500 / NCIMB 11436 / LSU 4) TaxID=761193 RepID=A0A7U4E729_RUNSL|nr:gluconate 2-dehydrogenase subunit 3 family protein [Runella slithyformis]AEI49888.1 twin-arginine translocation pathway signal [Runella slithyformis DSM 19594]